MARILIITDDKRLYRLLSLLVAEEGHTVVGENAPALVITDKEDLPARLSALPCLKIGEGGLLRPFSHKELKARIGALLLYPTLPLLSPTEERLFRILKDASPDFVSREELSLGAFGDKEDGGRLNLYIYYLRKKIETDGKKRIFAHRGKGYSLIC